MQPCVPFFITAAVVICTVTAIPTQHFVEYYPAYQKFLEEAGHEHCSADLEAYFNDDWSECDRSLPTCLTNRAYGCILEHVTEGLKVMMSAAAVLLGLLPTFLGIQGSTTSEIGLLMLRRPLLTSILSIGAPAIYPLRTTESDNPIEALERGGTDHLNLPRLDGWRGAAVSAIQYLLALGAATNIIIVSLELGTKAVCTFASNTIVLPLGYALSSLAVSAAAALCVHLRVRSISPSPKAHSLAFVKREGTLCILQGPAMLQLRAKTLTFVVCSWTLTTGTILQLMFGTLVLSSTVFVATSDAVGVAARYLASQMLCRAIVAFELSGMRERGDSKRHESMGLENLTSNLLRPEE